ncbi:hypothetical protein Moror_9641 [Moniliophthora roreri MCA 2997]|uniref:Retrotransposon gag domain-containing protein n=2 Tax=Moniliophthora roreri TaxID=221103 RepID=V2XQV2_MONRO|nr:hypothetical protein Moror_9641 [Moniliophthora roreri MCA 2997]
MKTSSEPSDEKIENSPDKLTSSSFFSAFEEETTMSEGGSSTPKCSLKEDPKTQSQMMIEVATAVLEEVEKKKKQEKGAKVATPDHFEGDRKETKRFLTEVEIFICMHPTDYDTNEKKCLFLLSYMWRPKTKAWKWIYTSKIFDKGDEDVELTWDELKKQFKKHYLPADLQAEPQLKIEEIKMTDQANNYVNEFCVAADESGYDDQALIHIFCKGLPFSLSDKILNQPQG